jgi:hypothetical protein
MMTKTWTAKTTRVAFLLPSFLYGHERYVLHGALDGKFGDMRSLAYIGHH